MPHRRYHFHTPGLVYVFVTLLVAIGAFNSQNNLLFWVFALSLSLLVISGLISGAMLMGIHAERLPIRGARSGSALIVRYRIRNRNRFMPAFALTIEESDDGHARWRWPGADRPTHDAPLPGKTGGIPRLLAFAPCVPPRGEIIVDAACIPSRRGPVGMSSFSVHSAFPFGLIRKSVRFDQATIVLVHPKGTTINHAEVLSQGGTRFEHPTRTGRSGHSDEFFALREYSVGDPMRSVAWRPSARRDTLLVRQGSHVVHSGITIVLFWSDDETDEQFEASVELAAGLVEASYREGAGSSLLIPQAGISIRGAAARDDRFRMLDALAVIRREHAVHARTNHQAVGPAIEIRGGVLLPHRQQNLPARPSRQAPGPVR